MWAKAHVRIAEFVLVSRTKYGKRSRHPTLHHRLLLLDHTKGTDHLLGGELTALGRLKQISIGYLS